MRIIYCIIIFCWACRPNDSQNISALKQNYIISEEDSLAKLKFAKDSIPPPPKDEFYGHFNFVIGTSDLVYFYKISYLPMICESDSYYPILLNLEPNDFIVLNEKYITDFIDLNINEKPESRRKMQLTISSPNDTIRQPVFFKLIKYLNIRKYNYYIRRSTEEEMQLIKNKKSGKFYTPENIEWKVTTTPFRFKNNPDS